MSLVKQKTLKTFSKLKSATQIIENSSIASYSSLYILLLLWVHAFKGGWRRENKRASTQIAAAALVLNTEVH